jgi:hypothetical protein
MKRRPILRKTVKSAVIAKTALRLGERAVKKQLKKV